MILKTPTISSKYYSQDNGDLEIAYYQKEGEQDVIYVTIIDKEGNRTECTVWAENLLGILKSISSNQNRNIYQSCNCLCKPPCPH